MLKALNLSKYGDNTSTVQIGKVVVETLIPRPDYEVIITQESTIDSPEVKQLELDYIT